MEMYKFAVFFIVINFVCGWFGVMDLTATDYDNYMANRINESNLVNQLQTESDAELGGDSIWDIAVYTASSVNLVLEMLYHTTMGLPNMLSNPPFDFPSEIVISIVAFQVIIYGVGLASFFRGVMIK